MPEPVQVEDLEAFLDWLAQEGNPSTIFRGQPETARGGGRPIPTRLLPKLGRTANNNLPATEREMFEAFKRASVGYLRTRPENDWEWLALAQHHGLATRLLDWAKNPLAALWFAAGPHTEPDTAARVWAFNPIQQVGTPTHDHGAPFPLETEGVLLFESSAISPRIIAQAGCFTVHSIQDGAMLELDPRGGHGPIRSARIEPRHFAEFRTNLRRLGVNQSTLFPDLDGLASELNMRHVR